MQRRMKDNFRENSDSEFGYCRMGTFLLLLLSRFLILLVRIFNKVAQLLGILASAVFTAVSEMND